MAGCLLAGKILTLLNFNEISKLNKVQLRMNGTVYALVNNEPEIPAMEAQCKQRDAACFSFHF